ncbi:MAG: hypothetical protein KC900_08970 [Candidatus Omnitrophica bacterium]|nr:hypothetical protein [Candidatus Omnitrophota bacterium]
MTALGVSVGLFLWATTAGLNHYDPMHYFQEHEFFTFFSALLLAGTSLIAALVNFLHHKIVDGYESWNFWLFSALGFFYLCLDEYFIIHEGIGSGVLRLFGGRESGHPFDEWVLAAFGVIGAVTICRYRKQVLQYGNFVFMFLVASMFFGCMIISDYFFEDTYPLSLFQEIFKILGVAFFFVAYLSVLYDIHMQIIHTEIDREPPE